MKQLLLQEVKMTKLVVEQNCQVRTPTKLEEKMINRKIEREYSVDVGKVIDAISDPLELTLSPKEATVYEDLKKNMDEKCSQLVNPHGIIKKNFGLSYIHAIPQLIQKGLLKSLSETRFSGKKGCRWQLINKAYKISTRSPRAKKLPQTPQKTFDITALQEKINAKKVELDNQINERTQLVEKIMFEMKQLQDEKKELETALKVISSLK